MSAAEAARKADDSAGSGHGADGAGSQATAAGRQGGRQATAAGRPDGATRVRAARRTQAERTAATRAALLAATVDCLVSQGFDRTTTSEVAHRAGVSAGALLHHFPAKADLLCAAVGHLFELRQVEFRKAMANLTPGADRIEAGVDLLWSMFSGPTFVAWLELWIAARCDPALADDVVRLDHEFMAASRAVFDELFADQVNSDPELATKILGLAYSLLAGLALFRLIPGHEPAPAADILTAFKAMARAALPAPSEAPHGR